MRRFQPLSRPRALAEEPATDSRGDRLRLTLSQRIFTSSRFLSMAAKFEATSWRPSVAFLVSPDAMRRTGPGFPMTPLSSARAKDLGNPAAKVQLLPGPPSLSVSISGAGTCRHRAPRLSSWTDLGFLSLVGGFRAITNECMYR